MWTVLAVLATVAVFYGATLPEQSRAVLHSRGVLHPYYHLGIFGGIALLAALSTRSTVARVVLCCAVALLGCVTEIMEWYLYGNLLEWTDILLDAMGAVSGTMLGSFTTELLARRGT